jgi:hypothetical protein
MPCLNERITIAEAVVQAKAAFTHWPRGVEVVVADDSAITCLIDPYLEGTTVRGLTPTDTLVYYSALYLRDVHDNISYYHQQRV